MLILVGFFCFNTSYGLEVMDKDLPAATLNYSDVPAYISKYSAAVWRLPTLSELKWIYKNKSGFAEYSYYLSNTTNKSSVYCVDFYNGEIIKTTKDGATSGIRRIRLVK